MLPCEFHILFSSFSNELNLIDAVHMCIGVRPCTSRNILKNKIILSPHRSYILSAEVQRAPPLCILKFLKVSWRYPIAVINSWVLGMTCPDDSISLCSGPSHDFFYYYFCFLFHDFHWVLEWVGRMLKMSCLGLRYQNIFPDSQFP